jgi:hypothetical protein
MNDNPTRYIPKSRTLSIVESVCGFFMHGKWQRSVVEMIPVEWGDPRWNDAPPSQLKMSVRFTGLVEPFPFMIVNYGDKEKEMDRNQSEQLCNYLSKQGNEKTKKICRMIRDRLKE